MGILANSVSKTMTSSGSDATSDGYVTRERITLTTNPTGASYSWSLNAPVTSSLTADALSDSTAAAPTFVPDAAGYYLVVCTVAGVTTYILRLTVHSVGVSHLTEVVRLAPIADAAVPAPASGRSLYYSSTQSALCTKDSAGAVRTVDETAV